MKKSKKRLKEYWDGRVLKLIPHNGNFQKVEQEAREHLGFLATAIKRIIIPLIVFYIVAGLFLDLNVFGSLLMSLSVILYSNFIPDIDFFIRKTDREVKESLWYEKYFWLFFAPLVLYYVLIGKAKPVYSGESRCFHNIRSALIYGIFLLILGHIFWNENIKIIMFVLFGLVGYLFHLTVDGIIFQSLFWKEKIEEYQKTKHK
jgi:hypothetical protein